MSELETYRRGHPDCPSPPPCVHDNKHACSACPARPIAESSFHCGSGCRDATAYSEALRVARLVFDLAARRGLRLTLLDMGGGFPGWDGSEWVYREQSRGVHCAGGGGGGEGRGVAGSSEAPGASRPLSLADIAEVTVPVLDELFPPESGVKVCVFFVSPPGLRAKGRGGASALLVGVVAGGGGRGGGSRVVSFPGIRVVPLLVCS